MRGRKQGKGGEGEVEGRRSEGEGNGEGRGFEGVGKREGRGRERGWNVGGNAEGGRKREGRHLQRLHGRYRIHRYCPCPLPIVPYPGFPGPAIAQSSLTQNRGSAVSDLVAVNQYIDLLCKACLAADWW